MARSAILFRSNPFVRFRLEQPEHRHRPNEHCLEIWDRLPTGLPGRLLGGGPNLRRFRLPLQRLRPHLMRSGWSADLATTG
jgi:hypothetical protein